MNIKKIIRIHELITKKQTGTPKELANKIGVSERMIYNYISFMKEELKAPIAYNNSLTQYYYTEDCMLSFKGVLTKN